MEFCKPRAGGLKFGLAEGSFNSREDSILFQAHVIVEHAAELDHQFRSEPAVYQRLLQIFHSPSYGRVVRKHAHDVGIFVQSNVARIPR